MCDAVLRKTIQNTEIDFSQSVILGWINRIWKVLDHDLCGLHGSHERRDEHAIET